MMRKVEADDPEPDTEYRPVLGVDVGVINIVVASTGTFWSAAEFNHWRQEYEKRRGSLQQRGTRAAHEAIESVGRKEYDRFEIYLHRVASELIEEAVNTVEIYRLRGPNIHPREHPAGNVATRLGVSTIVPICRIQSG